MNHRELTTTEVTILESFYASEGHGKPTRGDEMAMLDRHFEENPSDHVKVLQERLAKMREASGVDPAGLAAQMAEYEGRPEDETIVLTWHHADGRETPITGATLDVDGRVVDETHAKVDVFDPATGGFVEKDSADLERAGSGTAQTADDPVMETQLQALREELYGMFVDCRVGADGSLAARAIDLLQVTTKAFEGQWRELSMARSMGYTREVVENNGVEAMQDRAAAVGFGGIRGTAYQVMHTIADRLLTRREAADVEDVGTHRGRTPMTEALDKVCTALGMTQPPCWDVTGAGHLVELAERVGKNYTNTRGRLALASALGVRIPLYGMPPAVEELVKVARKREEDAANAKTRAQVIAGPRTWNAKMSPPHPTTSPFPPPPAVSSGLGALVADLRASGDVYPPPAAAPVAKRPRDVWTPTASLRAVPDVPAVVGGVDEGRGGDVTGLAVYTDTGVDTYQVPSGVGQVTMSGAMDSLRDHYDHSFSIQMEDLPQPAPALTIEEMKGSIRRVQARYRDSISEMFKSALYPTMSEAEGVAGLGRPSFTSGDGGGADNSGSEDT